MDADTHCKHKNIVNMYFVVDTQWFANKRFGGPVTTMTKQLLFVKYYCVKTHKCLLEILSKTSDAFCPGALGSKSLSYWVECIALAQHHKYQDTFVAP